jgi:hypothetical protein
MEWNPTWNDPLTSYVAAFDNLIGDKRTRKTFGETVRGIIGAGSLICQQIAGQSPVLSQGTKGAKPGDSTGDGGKHAALGLG